MICNLLKRKAIRSCNLHVTVVLLASARERAQALLEAYVRNIGAAVGREYAVRWELLEGEAPPPAEAEAPEGA